MRRALVRLALIASSLVPISAVAQPAAPPPSAPPADAAHAQALDLLHQGNALFEDGSYVEALEKFRAAYALVPSPKLLLNIGTTLRLLGRSAEAANVYDQYLHDPGRDPAREVEVQRLLAQLDAVVGHLRVYTATPGAHVTLDSLDLGTAPVDRTLRVEPGPHKIVAEKAGMQAYVVSPTLKGGENATVQAEPLPPGTVTRTVQSGRAQRIAGVVVGSVGIATAIVGGVFGGLALQANGDAGDHCYAQAPGACDATGVSLGSTASQRATISTVLLSVGGAAFAGGLILFLTAPKKAAAPKPSVALELGPRTDGGSIGVKVAW